jgi:homocysteine S-methyltransferase
VAAGANILITASYQATMPGFAKARGIDTADATRLLRLSVELAREAVAARAPAHPVLVAASVANYGAHLGDGSEFTGAYAQHMSVQQLVDFLRPHAAILAHASPDLLAFETVPSLRDAQAICTLLDSGDLVRADGSPVEAYVSFQCRDTGHIADGTSVEQVAHVLEQCTRVTAIGINCTSPALVSPLLARIPATSRLMRLVYPNSGETFDGATQTWHGQTEAVFCSAPEHLQTAVRGWHTAGAHFVGGCCRTSPAQIRVIAEALRTAPSTARPPAKR